LGAFFEYGRGDYDTHNSFADAASVRGGGTTDYAGGGLLGHFAFAGTSSGNFYAEAGGRMGRVRSGYSSSDLRDSEGRRAEYDTENLYYGLHLGVGYVWTVPGLDDRGTLDFSGKYFWTHQDGDSVTLSTGDRMQFRDVDSHRLRVGGRFAYALDDFISPYIGAAFEHDFGGEAEAVTNGYAVSAPTLRGSTGAGEIGVTVRPAAASPFSVDFGIQGYTGKREGLTGNLQLKFIF
jgi:outer membrane autotransporter protein